MIQYISIRDNMADRRATIEANAGREIIIAGKKPIYRKLIRILIFQTTATALLAYGILSTIYPVQPYPTPDPYDPLPNPYHSLFSSFTLLLVMSFAGQLTGGHANPAVTVGVLLSRDVSFSWPVLLTYLVSQWSGGLIGSMIGYFLVSKFTCPGFYQPDKRWGKKIVSQIFGSFIYVLFYILLSNSRTKFISSNFWTYTFLALVWFFSRQLVESVDGLNPATVLGLQLFYGFRFDGFAAMTSYWIYCLGPLLGGSIAALFFNLFLAPYYLRWRRYRKTLRTEIIY